MNLYSAITLLMHLQHTLVAWFIKEIMTNKNIDNLPVCLANIFYLIKLLILNVYIFQNHPVL
jgi:uncharacterized protein with PQ loop repeat